MEKDRVAAVYLWLYLNKPDNDFKSVRPIFRSRPAFVVGMPVCRATCLLAWSTPNALLHEKVTPGILNPCFFAITQILSAIVLKLVYQRGEKKCPSGNKCLFLEQSDDFSNPKYKWSRDNYDNPVHYLKSTLCDVKHFTANLNYNDLAYENNQRN